MGAIRMWLHAEMRHRWRAWLGLALLAGLAGGAVIAAVAGARRTETTQARFLAWAEAFDVALQPYGEDRDRALREIPTLPQVAEWAIIGSIPADFVTESGRTIPHDDSYAWSDPDGKVFRAFNRAKILAGRMSDPSRAEEVTVSVPIAERFGIKVGDRPLMRVIELDENGGATGKTLAEVRVRVVGIVVAPGDFRTLAGDFAGLQLTPAAHRLYGRYTPEFDLSPIVRLKRGSADLRAFRAELARHGFVYGENLDFFLLRDQTSSVARADGFQANGLRILGLLVALAAATIFGQSLARQTATDSADFPVLRAFGVSQRDLASALVIRAAAIGAAASVVAAGFAIVLSYFTPIGLARTAEPHPGFSFDGAVIGGGVVAVISFVVVLAIIPALFAARSARLGPAQKGARVSRLADALGRTAAPVPMVAGVRMTFEAGGGRTSVPVRSVIAGVALGLAVLIAALGFQSSIRNLLAEPRLTGWNWDAAFTVEGDQFETFPTEKIDEAAAKVAADPDVAVLTRGAVSDISVGQGANDPALELFFGIEPGQQASWPSIIEGRAPARPDEILLATETMRDADVRIGSTIVVRNVGIESDGRTSGEEGSPIPMRVVGRMAMPHLFFSTFGPGRGAAMTMSGLQRFYPDRRADTFLIRYREGADAGSATKRIGDALGEQFFEVPAPRPASDLDDIGRLVDAPASMAAFLVLGLAAIVGHALVSEIRRRRRDLAILKTFGFTRGQIFRTISWHATTLAIIGLIVAIPVGIALGRWAWNFFAGRISVVPEAVNSLASLIGAAVGALLLANVVALLPARSAARTKPALVLRSE